MLFDDIHLSAEVTFENIDVVRMRFYVLSR
jgi:hypothetical protein